MKATKFVAILAVAGLALAACGGDDDDEGGDATTAGQVDGRVVGGGDGHRAALRLLRGGAAIGRYGAQVSWATKRIRRSAVRYWKRFMP